jgi:uncharacterized repeat protein (TIGR03803 family)
MKLMRSHLVMLFAVILVILVPVVHGETYSVLHSFTGAPPDGKYANGSLVLNGSTLYGTTSHGGDATADAGTVFSLSCDGKDYSVLHAFAGGLHDGDHPFSGPILSGSTLYGTTFGNNAIYAMSTSGGGPAILHQFIYGEGLGAVGGLTLDRSTLYGTTQGGGTTNLGTVFSIGANGSGYRILHSFEDGSGVYPKSTLVLSGQTLYGTTVQTGTETGGGGSVFAVDSDGSDFRLLHSFGDLSSDACGPEGGLILSGSTLYGTTWAGGKSAGTIYSVSTAGTDFKVLHEFSGAAGQCPQSGLLLAGSTFFGTTWGGGDNGLGTVYSMDMDGTDFRVLYSFTGENGAHPTCDLILNGSTLYGTTSRGGSSDYGVVFALTVPEPSNFLMLAAAAFMLLAYAFAERSRKKRAS